MAVNTDKTEEEQTARLVPVAPQEVLFEGQAQSLALEKGVQEAQLIEEVYDHLGDRGAFQVLTTTGEDGIKTLHVLGDADMDGVKAVVDAHDPDPDFGLEEGDRQVRELLGRLREGQDLKVAELNALLRGVL